MKTMLVAFRFEVPDHYTELDAEALVAEVVKEHAKSVRQYTRIPSALESARDFTASEDAEDAGDE